jgi:hypothetical protein
MAVRGSGTQSNSDSLRMNGSRVDNLGVVQVGYGSSGIALGALKIA